MATRTYDPQDGDVLDAPQWRSELDAMYVLQSAINGAKMINNSITRRKIADRYTLVPFYNEMVPKTPRVDPTLGAAHDSLDPATGYASDLERCWECSNNGTEIEGLSLPVITRVGSDAWLSAILIKAKEVVTRSAGWPQVRIYRGIGTGRQLLGGGPQIIDTAERWFGLFGLDLTGQALALGLAAHAVGLGLDHARRVALDPDPERVAEIERLLVGEPELSCQLVHAYT